MKKLAYSVGVLLLVLSTTAPAAELPAPLQGLGLRESSVASRDLPGWKKPQRILVSTRFGPQIIEPLRAVAPGVELVPVNSAEEAAREASDAQAIIGFCAQDILENADQLHWVQVYFAGVENCVSLPGMQSGIVLSNGQRLSSPTIADHAIALTYALVRGLDMFHGEQASGNWSRSSSDSLRSFGEL